VEYSQLEALKELILRKAAAQKEAVLKVPKEVVVVGAWIVFDFEINCILIVINVVS
jgi:hypothetical protein